MISTKQYSPKLNFSFKSNFILHWIFLVDFLQERTISLAICLDSPWIIADRCLYQIHLPNWTCIIFFWDQEFIPTLLRLTNWRLVSIRQLLVNTNCRFSIQYHLAVLKNHAITSGNFKLINNNWQVYSFYLLCCHLFSIVSRSCQSDFLLKMI